MKLFDVDKHELFEYNAPAHLEYGFADREVSVKRLHFGEDADYVLDEYWAGSIQFPGSVDLADALERLYLSGTLVQGHC